MPMRTVVALSVLLAALPAWAQDNDTQIAPDIGSRVVERYAVPVLSAFEAATAELAGSMTQLCEAPTAERVAAVRADFAEAVAAWGKVSVLRFGPLQADNRYERIFFWPDPRGIALRQVQGVLGEKDESAASAATLGEKSAALQGIPALEFVLYGTGHEELADGTLGFRCRYGQAIAGNLVALAGEVAEGWAAGTAFHDGFTAPGPDRDLYRSTREVAGEVVKALSTGLQFVRNAELQPALGETPDKARGKRAPLWRSDLTFALVASQVGGLDALMASAFEGTLSETGAGLLGSIQFELEHGLDALEKIDVPAETAFSDEEARGLASYAAITLHGANETLNGNFSAAIGLTMGFNALDGD